MRIERGITSKDIFEAANSILGIDLVGQATLRNKCIPDLIICLACNPPEHDVYEINRVFAVVVNSLGVLSRDGRIEVIMGQETPLLGSPPADEISLPRLHYKEILGIKRTTTLTEYIIDEEDKYAVNILTKARIGTRYRIMDEIPLTRMITVILYPDMDLAGKALDCPNQGNGLEEICLVTKTMFGFQLGPGTGLYHSRMHNGAA
ncbi:hypothetical protein KKE78_04880 [Patescibacteria group bacterium]|nr:hypothetical protein [Patescibacteria group bacterium]